ncbi:hypothetical protein [Hymenobacter jejuensis]|uniref:hypothetical protein n=1 Tax=Hymenobacter jejuensis TaxID=2502781 RepID=UPI0018AD5CC7|nr:hypothetical protein [Hymenobacter jejuensis]
MKHLSGLLNKLTAVAACAIALSSCNRAEYAMLPKTSSYHGTTTARAVAATPANQPETPVAAEEAAVATPVAAPEPAPAVAAAPAPAKMAPVAKAAAPAKSQTAAPKLNLVQKALVQKAVKKADKMMSKMQLKKHSEVASADDANALNHNIRTGIILLLIGLLLSLFTGISGIFGVLGGIIAIIGIVLIILGLLDEV